jgi:uncharacterized protein (TIGR03083 family)
VPLSAAYRASTHDFLRTVRRLTDDQLARQVPACPGWTVQDLLAHQAGSSSDFVSRNLDGVTSAPWTARQVEERRGRTVDDLVREWQGNVDAVAPLCDLIPGPNPAWDVAVHLADLREAVPLEPVPPERGWAEVLTAVTAFLREQAGVTVSVAECGPDPAGTTWHFASAYGLWRALFSRRSRADLAREITRGDPDAFRAVAFFGDPGSAEGSRV